MHPVGGIPSDDVKQCLKYIDGYMDAVLKEHNKYTIQNARFTIRKAVTRRHENDMKYKVNTFFNDTCNTNETKHFHSY